MGPFHILLDEMGLDKVGRLRPPPSSNPGGVGIIKVTSM